ncbi:MAG: hypothetical protein K2Y51_09380 [Gammaproteobacteria bacterium]|nr:hypothetical protein [Gammaproteobacteria bacterium]
MIKKSPLAPVATAVVITLGAVSVTEAADNPFAAQAFERGYQVAAEQGEMSCGAGMSEGKCGAGAAEAKADAAKAEAAKAGESKCGAGLGETKAGEGKCGS